MGPFDITGKILSSSSLFWLLSNLADPIWEDKALLQIKSYSLFWSVLKYFLTLWGDLIISVGLIASWASWAFLAFFPE